MNFSGDLPQYNITLLLTQKVRTAVLSMGFSLSFGALFSKTWRVHKIFTAAKTLKKLVRSLLIDLMN